MTTEREQGAVMVWGDVPQGLMADRLLGDSAVSVLTGPASIACALKTEMKNNLLVYRLLVLFD